MDLEFHTELSRSESGSGRWVYRKHVYGGTDNIIDWVDGYIDGN